MVTTTEVELREEVETKYERDPVSRLEMVSNVLAASRKEQIWQRVKRSFDESETNKKIMMKIAKMSFLTPTG
eukprot:scaffold9526_cov247-Amphora_coffeaeformis.AAC.4